MAEYKTRFLADIFDMMARIVVGSIFLLARSVPGGTGNGTRNKIQRKLLSLLSIHIGTGSQISPGFFIFQRKNFKCGRNCRLGYGFSVWNHSPFEVGDDLLASHCIKVICGTHQTNSARTNISGPVRIGNNVWIGANVLIIGPCTIGDNVIIGANSFVTGDIAAKQVIGGSPARHINVNKISSRPEHI